MAGKQLSLIKYQKHKPASTLKKLTPKERLGKVNESVIKSSLTKACNELGLTLIWSGQEAYKKGLTNQQKHDADFKVYYTAKGKYDIKEKTYPLIDYECKNWRNGFNYASETAQTEVINRYNDSFYEHGLIITFLDCFGRPAQEHIETKIHDNIIETGKLIGSKDFRNRELYISLYNQLKANLTASLSKMQNYLNHIQTKLTKVLTPFQPTQQLNFSDTVFSMLLQSNTIGNTISDTVVNTISQLNQTINNTPLIDYDSKLSYSNQIDNEPDKFDIDKDIKRAKECGLFDDYGFSS